MKLKRKLPHLCSVDDLEPRGAATAGGGYIRLYYHCRVCLYQFSRMRHESPHIEDIARARRENEHMLRGSIEMRDRRFAVRNLHREARRSLFEILEGNFGRHPAG